MEYIELKVCPICGAHPDKKITDMGRPGGHGYPGHYSYGYECDNCRLLKGATFNDLCGSPAEANKQAKLFWNGVVNKVQEYLDKIYVKK